MNFKFKYVIILFYFILCNTSKANNEITVMLDWFINPDHAPLYVALEKGYFDEENIKVNFIVPADPNDPPKLAAAKKIDLAISYQPQLHMQIDQGLPLIRVGTLVATPLNCLLVLEEGNIKKISDLKGKKIGYSVGGFEDTLLKTILRSQNLLLSDVELINVNFSLSPALISKKVDAVIGAFRNFELNQLNLLNKTGKAFYVEEHGVPPYDELIFVTHKDNLQENSKILSFLRATEKGVHYLINHPDESWKLFIKDRPELDDKLNRKAWFDTIPRFALRPAAMDRKRYERFAQYLKREKSINKALNWQRYGVELE
ncbi:MAG: putative thiamine biosynthesis protein [Alphaproteobacteria bacterium MarineAlpha2_Bin1]|nr:MAG: putative thiamine biosynthesis protein [Alphaproteobacteria bacterium MarineAlpha2_Bin1]